MRSIKVAILCATGLLAVASFASAADMALPSPAYNAPAPLVVVQGWTGFYIGAHAGWGWGRDNFSEQFEGFTCDPTGACVIPAISMSGTHSSGFLAGLQAGYNQQWANWLGGLEIDLSGTDIKGSTSSSATGIS